MTRKVTAKLGFEGNYKSVELNLPDSEPAPWDADFKPKIINHHHTRLDGIAKVTGKAKYTHDINLPGMLYGRFVRSPYPAAAVKAVDTSKAERLAGVKAIELIENKTIKFAGQEVAAIAATSPDIAEQAARLIEVEYEIKPFVVNATEARGEQAPLVHGEQVEERRSAGDAPGRVQRVAQKGNVRGPQQSNRGDVEKGFAEADVIFEQTYTTQVQTHSALETHGIVAQWDGNKLRVWASTQGTFGVRDELARALNVPQTDVLVTTDYMGGGFGAKFGAGLYGVTAAKLAKKAGAPVKLMLDRKEEHLCVGNRPSSEQRVKIGAKRDGTLTAISVVNHGTAGIGTGAGATRPYAGIYENCPNVHAEDYDVFTNAGPAASMRAPGHPQGCFGLESAIDELAEKLGMDPIELRLKNDPHPVRRKQYEIGAVKANWKARLKSGTGAGAKRRGLGCASSIWYNTGRARGAQVQIDIHNDGAVDVYNGAQDIGTGTRTWVAQVAAEELGLPLDAVQPHIANTNYPVGPASGGSTTVPTLAPAVRSAAFAAKQKMFEIAAPVLGVAATDLESSGGKIFVKGSPARSLTWKQVANKMTGDKITVLGDRAQNYEAFVTTTAGAQFAEVEVDTETGDVRVLRVVAVHDCGLPLNRLTTESQINGGVIQGISYALFENRLLDPASGVMINPNFEEYKIAGSHDIPKIDIVLLDVANGVNNTSSVGIGEPAVVATPGAVANAVANAIGVHIRDLPITPAKILAALKDSEAAPPHGSR